MLPHGIDRLATVAPGTVRSWCGRRTAADVRYRSRSSGGQVGGRIDDGPDEPVPVADVLVPGALEVAGQRGAGLEPGLLGPGPEREGELGHAAVERELGHAGHVAGVRRARRSRSSGRSPRSPASRRTCPRSRRPGAPAPGRMPAPAPTGRSGRRASAGPCRCPPRRGRGGRRTRGAARAAGRAAAGGPTAPGRPASRGVLEPGLDADDVGVVVGADAQGERVARVAVHGRDRRHAPALVADLVGGIALDLAPEPGVVGHDEAEVADLGPVDVRPVDLVEDAAARS